MEGPRLFFLRTLRKYSLCCGVCVPGLVLLSDPLSLCDGEINTQLFGLAGVAVSSLDEGAAGVGVGAVMDSWGLYRSENPPPVFLNHLCGRLFLFSGIHLLTFA